MSAARTLRAAAAAGIVLAAGAGTAGAHQLNVFASTDCEVVRIEAKFSSGRVPVGGEVRILNGQNTLLATLALTSEGTLSVPLAGLDAATGLLIEVDTGDHEDYWIVTPQDIAGACPG